jgi:acyl carrier protein
MNMNQKIFEQLKQIVRDYLGDDKIGINEDSILTDDLGLSSLDLISIVGSVEDAFNIEVQDKDVAEIRTIKDVVDYIEKKQKA